MDLEKHPGKTGAFHPPEGRIGVITIGDERGAAGQGDLSGPLAQQAIGDGEMGRVLATVETGLQGPHESGQRTHGLRRRNLRVMTDLREPVEVLPA